MKAIAPATEDELRDAVAGALADAEPLEIIGAGTRRGFGRPAEAARRLSTRRLSNLIFYEPSELVVSGQAGAPLADIVDLLDRHGQEFAFEPIDHSAFYGGAPGGGTLGGMIATNASGPRRVKAGAARDHLLGFRGVTGRGDLVKSGGRVMKNVTGYDLSKLVTGSHGALVVLTEVTLKVLPKAETQATLLVSQADEERGLALLREAAGLPLDISGFALTPTANVEAPTCAALRFEGPAVSVAARRDAFMGHLRGRPMRVETLDALESRAFWTHLRDAGPIRSTNGQIWRLSTAPTDAGPLVAAIKRAQTPVTSYFFDWVGGLVWLAVEPAADAHAGLIRGAFERFHGHATLMRADASTRASVEVFQPQAPALAALTKRMKDSFDPLRILNPGHLRADL